MKQYVVALCILALALVGMGIALDGTDIVEKSIEPNRDICGEKYQAGYEAGYQAGKLAAYQEIAEMANQRIYELQTGAAGEYKPTAAEIVIGEKETLIPWNFTFPPREKIPL